MEPFIERVLTAISLMVILDDSSVKVTNLPKVLKEKSLI